MQTNGSAEGKLWACVLQLYKVNESKRRLVDFWFNESNVVADEIQLRNPTKQNVFLKWEVL